MPGAAAPDGIYFDAFNERVYVFSHPTKDATVIDAKDGAMLGTIDLGGVPEQGVADGKGMLYVVMQDAQGSVTAVDVKTMKAVGALSLGDKGRCNGLAFDAKNHVLFAACANSGNPPAQPAQPMMVILSATDGKIFTSLPLAGGSDGAVFNPSTMEAFSTHGNGTLTVVKEKSPTTFEVEQNLQTMNGARTITLDSKTNHILTMSQERGPAPPPPPAEAVAGQGVPVPGSFTIVMVGQYLTGSAALPLDRRGWRGARAGSRRRARPTPAPGAPRRSSWGRWSLPGTAEAVESASTRTPPPVR
jgi:DNA-binding beta-propeller fold protein YncE